MERGPLACAALAGAAAGAVAVLALQRRTGTVRHIELPRYFLGIDIGGTTMTVGLVNERGEILGQVSSEPLGDNHDPQVIVNRIAQLAMGVLKSASCTLGEVAAVGVCCPGLLDFERGLVKAAANLRGWRDVALPQLLADALGIDRSLVVLENDGNTALLAELWVGAAQGKKDVVLLTLGTGIGAGVLAGGHLLRGHTSFATELGHMILVPGGRPNAATGVDGIWEMYASATAVRIRAGEGWVPDNGHIGVGGVPADSSLHGQDVTCKLVFEKAAEGDVYARRIVQDTAKFLAIGSINCARFCDPELILFTGGMVGGASGEQLLTEVREQFKLHHWSIQPVTLDFRIAAAPAHAGLIGAAYAALRSCS